MPSSHLILCRPLLLLPPIPPSLRVFSNESTLRMRWPKHWSFSFSISPSNEYSGLISLGLTGWISLQSKGLSRVFSNTTVQKHQFFSTQFSLWSNSPSIRDHWKNHRLMLKLKLQCFGHPMQRVDSLERTLMLGGIGGYRRRGQQRMRWLRSEEHTSELQSR